MSRRLTSLLVLGLATFSVAIPAISLGAATQRTDFCPGQRTPPCGESQEKGSGVGSSPPPASSDRKPRNVRDRWRSPHRNLSTSN